MTKVKYCKAYGCTNNSGRGQCKLDGISIDRDFICFNYDYDEIEDS